MVGTMLNLVNEVLQSAVGNHFRNTLQDLEAIRFIETRHEVQRAAFDAISEYLAGYEVETRGVYIQDVVFPDELVDVLTRREIANQERATYEEQQRAETARIEMEKARGHGRHAGRAGRRPGVGRDQRATRPQAREAEAGGEAAYVRLTGQAEADRTQAIGLAEAKAAEALGLARAAGFEAQREAIGEIPTALVAVANAIAEGEHRHHAGGARHRRFEPRRPRGDPDARAGERQGHPAGGGRAERRRGERGPQWNANERSCRWVTPGTQVSGRNDDADPFPQAHEVRSARVQLRQERLHLVGHPDRPLVVELAHPHAARRPARPHLLEQPLTLTISASARLQPADSRSR